MRENFLTFKNYLIDKFGYPLYRIPINLPFLCPHVKNNSGGCIFCAEDRAKAVHLKHNYDIKTQVEVGKQNAEKLYNAGGNYIAYFQSKTNTNAPVELLRNYYEEALSHANFKMVIISTRPDCLGKEILDYLKELNRRYELWVELGIQSCRATTLENINRKHNYSDIKKAVKDLNSLGIKTAAHIILGLPGENYKDYRYTINELRSLPFSAIKFHNLLILKNSPLGKNYNKLQKKPTTGKLKLPDLPEINLLNEFEYAAILIDLIRRIPPEWPILRFNSDAPEKQILAPKWNISKGEFINLVQNIMNERNYYQGELYQNDSEDISSVSPLSELKIKTKDDSFTYYNPNYHENFHTYAGAKSEAINKYIKPSGLEDKLINNKQVSLLDIGFGLGYNALSALEVSRRVNGKLHVTSFEYDKSNLKLAQEIFKDDAYLSQIIKNLTAYDSWKNENDEIIFINSDARSSLSTINQKYDIVYLDPFSQVNNPELWSYDFIRTIKNKMEIDSVLVTFSSAYPVLGALLKNDFYIGYTPSFGRKRGGIIASLNRNNINNPISEKDFNIISKSTAGTPYRDRKLAGNRKELINYRIKLIKRLKKKGIPKWYK